MNVACNASYTSISTTHKVLNCSPLVVGKRAIEIVKFKKHTLTFLSPGIEGGKHKKLTCMCSLMVNATICGLVNASKWLSYKAILVYIERA